MSPVKPGEFILEQRHIEHGLTREDFNRYAGYPVLDFYLSDLPHWDELLENGILPHAKQQERSAALFKKIAEEGVSKRFSNPSFFEDAAWDSSTCACQAARDIDVSWTKKKKFINSINSAGLGSCGYTKPIDVSKFCGFFSWNRAPSFAVFPGVVGKIDYNKSFGQNRAAIVMRVPVDVNGTQMRLKQNGLLNDPFKSASFQKQLSLAGDLHEMRHLLQVTTS
ncbi:MAG: hypothetical protein PHX43_09390, partial [Alphaproteobacteria bacterium]|nr:hypothetical protein [Alphaproteobacteria bacterium]